MTMVSIAKCNIFGCECLLLAESGHLKIKYLKSFH